MKLLLLLFLTSAAKGEVNIELPENPERTAEVAACAACHAKQYEEWKSGPHANASKMLVVEFKDVVGQFPPGQQKKELAAKMKSICIDCHSPRADMYEGSLDHAWDGKALFTYLRRGEVPDSFTRSTAIDCLTCHKKGDRVVTRADYAPKPGFVPPSGFCDPIPSKTFSHTLNCVSCHSGVVEATRAGFDAGEIGHCNSCHLAKTDGKTSHYYLWSANKRKVETIIRSMFDGFSASLVRKNGETHLILDWSTDFAPHRLIPDTPKVYRVGFEILDEGGEVVDSRIVRFYDLSPASNRTEAAVRPTNRDGELVSLAAGERFTRSYKLLNPIPGAGTLLMTVGKKSKFHKTDSQATFVYEREVEYAF